MKSVRTIIFIFSCLAFQSWSIFRTNFFQPYDILLVPRIPVFSRWDLSATYEGAVSIHGMQAEEDNHDATFSKKVNVLQLWQTTQDALAALKGTCTTNEASLLAELFNVNDDNSVQGLFCFNGKLHAQNILFSARYHFHHNINLGLYIPFARLTLSDVALCEYSPLGSGVTEEQVVAHNNLINQIAQLGRLNFNGWERTGIGDVALIAWWRQHYLQDKPWLRDVHISLRGGMTFPSGKKQDDDILIGVPFGYDAGVGILFGATLEVWFNHNIHFGVDTQFLAHFGTTKSRRIKTDITQTDLMFLTQLKTFKNPGVDQHYTLFGEIAPFARSFSARLAYQFTKHSEDKIYFCSDCFSPTVVNSAESLLDWTTHSIILQLSYDSASHIDPCNHWNPFVSAFAKIGINGSRALVADTLGLTFNLSF
jgi:hypothetical protein